MKKYIRKADIILFIVLVVTGIAASAVLAMHGVNSGADAKVIIKSGGTLYATYPLSDEQTIVVPAPGQSDSDDYNTVVISDGKVEVTESSCKNQVCVKHGAISQTGESIVCLPNRLVVTIEANGGSGEGEGYDTVTS